MSDDRLTVKTSDGELVIWDVHSAHPITKTLSSAPFCWTLTEHGMLMINEDGTQCINQYLAIPS